MTGKIVILNLVQNQDDRIEFLNNKCKNYKNSMLYIIATPIGNLADITLRALEILKSMDYILCEDTRVTKNLLNFYEIKNKKLISYHQHTDNNKINKLVSLIRDNNVALVTDAGTPGISDPGNKLISELLTHFSGGPTLAKASEKIEIVPIPGASALTTALSISGLPTDEFVFLGFVPNKKGRQKFLQQVLNEKRTVIFYESKYRIVKALEQLCHPELVSGSNEMPKQVRHDKKFVVCRELTKKFETIYRGNISEVLEQVKNDKIKGEYTVIAG